MIFVNLEFCELLLGIWICGYKGIYIFSFGLELGI